MGYITSWKQHKKNVAMVGRYFPLSFFSERASFHSDINLYYFFLIAGFIDKKFSKIWCMWILYGRCQRCEQFLNCKWRTKHHSSVQVIRSTCCLSSSSTLSLTQALFVILQWRGYTERKPYAAFCAVVLATTIHHRLEGNIKKNVLQFTLTICRTNI